MPTHGFCLVNAHRIEIKQPKRERIHITNEWDVMEICSAIINHISMSCSELILKEAAEYVPHNIWSTLVIVFCLFVLLRSWHKLMAKNGATLKQLFGMARTNDETLTKIDASRFDIIVFDEIYFVDIIRSSKIKTFVSNHEDNNYYCNWRYASTRTNEYSSAKNYDWYADECINSIFPYELYLFENNKD